VQKVPGSSPAGDKLFLTSETETKKKLIELQIKEKDKKRKKKKNETIKRNLFDPSKSSNMKKWVFNQKSAYFLAKS